MGVLQPVAYIPASMTIEKCENELPGSQERTERGGDDRAGGSRSQISNAKNAKTNSRRVRFPLSPARRGSGSRQGPRTL